MEQKLLKYILKNNKKELEMRKNINKIQKGNRKNKK